MQPLPVAAAPTVTIASQSDIAENETASLSATVSGGTYDSLAYAWSDGGAGGSFSTQSASTVYTPPDVASDTSVTVTCTVTAIGTGTIAETGTSDTSSDTESFAVTPIPPPFIANASLDISLGSGTWRGGASDGTTLWFVDDDADAARAYVASTRARDAASDITLGSGNWSQGGLGDGTTLWFLDNRQDNAVAYTAATGARDSGGDISLGTGAWRGGASDGTTLWFVDDASNEAVAYVASTGARDSGKDISLGAGSWQGGFSDGTTLWFINNSTDTAVAYTASSQAHDSFKDFGTEITASNGAVYADNRVWFVEGASDTAKGFTGPLPDADAPAVTIADQSDITKNETASLSVSVSGGTYDALAYAWSDGGAGGSFSAQAASTVYTPPDVGADTAVTVTCEVTATGTGTNAADGTSDTGSDTETFVVRSSADVQVAGGTRHGIEGAGVPRLAQVPRAASQAIALQASWYSENFAIIRWNAGTSGPAIDSALTAGTDEVRFASVTLSRVNGRVDLDLASGGNSDLTAQFEQSGTLAFAVGDLSLTVALAGADMTEPYSWIPANDAEVEAFADAVADLSGNQAGTLTLDNGVLPNAEAPAVTITPQADIDEDGTASLSASVSGGTYDSLAYAWDDGGAGGSFSVQESATVSGGTRRRT